MYYWNFLVYFGSIYYWSFLVQYNIEKYITKNSISSWNTLFLELFVNSVILFTVTSYSVHYSLFYLNCLVKWVWNTVLLKLCFYRISFYWKLLFHYASLLMHFSNSLGKVFIFYIQVHQKILFYWNYGTLFY